MLPRKSSEQICHRIKCPGPDHTKDWILCYIKKKRNPSLFVWPSGTPLPIMLGEGGQQGRHGVVTVTGI